MSTALTSYRVWADGTVQDCEDEPYAWMSDDFMVIEAEDEDAAHDEAERRCPATATRRSTELAQRFDAADVATAAAQGFRDGVAAWDAAKKAKDTI